MKQYPSRIFYKKPHKPNKSYLSIIDNKTCFLERGQFGLKSLKSGRLTFKQIEAGRKTIRRAISKLGKLYIKVFTNVSLTKKGLGLRMGKGKGSHDIWICPIRAGQIIYEISGVKYNKVNLALRKASDKMPFPCILVKLTY
jgi:large subunit ribosomal protein L16